MGNEIVFNSTPILSARRVQSRLFSLVLFICMVEKSFTSCLNFLYKICLSLTFGSYHFTPALPDLSKAALTLVLTYVLTMFLHMGNSSPHLKPLPKRR